MRSRMLLTAQAVLLSFAAAAISQAQTLEARRERVLARDVEVTEVAPTRQVTVVGIAVPSAPLPVARIRVHLRLVNPGTGPATIVIEDGNGTEVERVHTSDFVNGEHWSLEVKGGSAHVRLMSAVGNVEVHVDKFGTPVVIDKPQAIVGADDSKPITDAAVPPNVKLLAPAIARLKFVAGGIPSVCTGFLVGNELLMTNQHCISNSAEAASAVVEFGVDTSGSVPISFRVTKIEAVDARLDYSLLRLSSDASKFGRLFLGSAVVTQMPLAVVQHPQGLPKKAAFPPNCSVGSISVAGVDGILSDFGHVCDTLGGSSGSPVVASGAGTVVGLHHWRWPDGAKVPENQAVHITLVVDDLVKRVKAGTLAKTVLDEVTRPRPLP